MGATWNADIFSHSIRLGHSFVILVALSGKQMAFLLLS